MRRTDEQKQWDVDVSISDMAGFKANDGSSISELAGATMAHELHDRALRDLGPSSERCSWDWYAHDGGEGHDRVALAADLGHLNYPAEAVNDLLLLWDAATMPVVAIHQQRAKPSPLVN